jgi:hypothetical protein
MMPLALGGQLTRVCRTGALVLMLVICFSVCGGGSASSPIPSAGTPITVSFSTASPPSAVAEQIGSGAWATASLQGCALHLILPPGTTRYAIAYVCPVANSVNSEYHLR